VVAATNRDLRQEADEGRFRLDLYYRLGVFPMQVPPLRDRSEDIPELMEHFVRQASIRFHVPAPGIPHREIDRAQRYNWPGNVRELQNVVERAVIMARGGKLALDLPHAKALVKQDGQSTRSVTAPPDAVIPEKEWRNRERANVLAALQRAQFRISGRGGAADLLGLNPGTLTSRLKALGIDKRDYAK
jgi:DNA-binding NtrC family response regulator